MPTALADCKWGYEKCTWRDHCLGQPCNGSFNDCSNDWICVQGICALECSNTTSAVLPKWVSAATSLATRTSSTTPAPNTASITDTPSKSTNAPAAASTTATSDDSGLSTGGAIGIGVAIPLVVIAIATAAFLYWRKTKRVAQLENELDNRNIAPPLEPKVASIPPSDGGGAPPVIEAGSTHLSEMAATTTAPPPNPPVELPAGEMAPPPAYVRGDVKMDATAYEQNAPQIHEAPGATPTSQTQLVADAPGTPGRPPISPMGSETMMAPPAGVVSPATPRQQANWRGMTE